MSVAKVLCSSKNIPLSCISTLQLYAGLSEHAYVLLDARSKRAYFAHYHLGKLIGDEIVTTLDEITNTYITELLVNRIMSFRKYKIENNNLKRYLDSLKTNQTDGKYRAIGYNSEVKLLYPLLLNEIFINLINQHQFDGEISLIKEFIGKNSNICNYEQLCELLDTIYNDNVKYPQEAKNNNIDFVHEHINNINYAKSIVLDINKTLVKKR